MLPVEGHSLTGCRGRVVASLDKTREGNRMGRGGESCTPLKRHFGSLRAVDAAGEGGGREGKERKKEEDRMRAAAVVAEAPLACRARSRPPPSFLFSFHSLLLLALFLPESIFSTSPRRCAAGRDGEKGERGREGKPAQRGGDDQKKSGPGGGPSR